MNLPAAEHRIRAAWGGRGALARLLWPLSRVYGALAARHQRRAGASATRLAVPVIVIGNVVAGGAGKTPTTLAVVRHLQARGWSPGIVSRGHGRRSAEVLAVAPDADPREVGDEPLLLRRASGAPVYVAPARAEAGRALLAAHAECDVLVCDDGLQHAALARDVEIAVFDSRGLGNGWLLPAGPLREPWPRPVDLLLHTESGGNVAVPPGALAFRAERALAEHAVAADGTRVALTALRGEPLTALAGIARPEAFFRMLRAAGLNLAATLALPDHYDFDSFKSPTVKRQRLICTEKDAVKLWRHAPQALAVPLRLRVPPAFFAALDERLAARGYHAPQAEPPGA